MSLPVAGPSSAAFVEINLPTSTIPSSSSSSRAAAGHVHVGSDSFTNSSKNNNKSLVDPASGMIVDADMQNGHGSTTEDSSAAARPAVSVGLNGTLHGTENGKLPGQGFRDDDLSSSSSSVASPKSPTSTVYRTSDEIIHRAFRPATGASRNNDTRNSKVSAPATISKES